MQTDYYRKEFITKFEIESKTKTEIEAKKVRSRTYKRQND